MRPEASHSDIQRDYFANGQITRLSVPGQGHLRTEIRLTRGAVTIATNNPTVALATSSFGYMLIWNRDRSVIKSFVEIKKDPGGSSYSFHENGDQIGSADGPSFDLALAGGLYKSDAELASKSKGNTIQDGVVSRVLEIIQRS